DVEEALVRIREKDCAENPSWKDAARACQALIESGHGDEQTKQNLAAAKRAEYGERQQKLQQQIQDELTAAAQEELDASRQEDLAATQNRAVAEVTRAGAETERSSAERRRKNAERMQKELDDLKKQAGE